MLTYKKLKIFDIDLYGLGAIMGICALTWIFIISPLDEKLIRQRQDQQEYQQNNQSAQTKLTRLQELVRRRQALAASLSQTRNVLRESMQIPEVIRELGRLCNRADVRLDEIIPGSAFHGEHYRKTSLSLRLFSTFPQIHQLLANMEEMLPYVKVSSLSLSNKRGAELGMCNITMDLDIFGP